MKKTPFTTSWRHAGALNTSATQLTSHMSELKSRVGYVLLSSVLALVVAYWKATQLIYIFLLSFSLEDSSRKRHLSPNALAEQDSPVGDVAAYQKGFIFTDVYEAFSSTICICSFACLCCVVPFAAYQCLCFALPSWQANEKDIRCKHVLVVLSCWMVYMCLTHSFVIQRLCSFLLQFQIETDCLAITLEPRIVSYVSWSAGLLGLATFLFFLVYIFYLCAFYGIVDIKKWSQDRKLFLLASLLLASLISPPELWSQSLLAVTLFLLCELLIWSCFLYNYAQIDLHMQEKNPDRTV